MLHYDFTKLSAINLRRKSKFHCYILLGIVEDNLSHKVSDVFFFFLFHLGREILLADADLSAVIRKQFMTSNVVILLFF